MEKMCFVNQASLIDTIEPLVGVGRIKPSEGFDVWTNLQIIDQGKQGGKMVGIITAGVLTGFEAVFADCSKGNPQLLGILSFSHQADASN